MQTVKIIFISVYIYPDVLKYWETEKPSISRLEQMEIYGFRCPNFRCLNTSAHYGM